MKYKAIIRSQIIRSQNWEKCPKYDIKSQNDKKLEFMTYEVMIII